MNEVMIAWDNYAWLRIANILVVVVVMTAMGISFARRYRKTPRRLRRLAASQYIFLCAVAYGSGRAASLHAPVAEHVVFLFLSLVVLAFSWLWHPEGDESIPGPDDRAIPARAKRALVYYIHNLREGHSMNEHKEGS